MKENIKSKLINKLSDEKGITIIEIFLSTLLILVIVTLATMSFFNATNATDITINTATSVRDARTAVYRINKDIREISTIEEADKDEVIFYSNIDSDASFERVHYYLLEDPDPKGHGLDFWRVVEDSEDKILVKHVISDEVFSYITGYGEASLDVPVDSLELENIRNISINLIIDQESETEGVRTMNYETSVTLRNRI